MIRILAACFFGLITTMANATELRAWLDRDTMQLGETVTLNIEISGTTNNTSPDLSALKADFNLLGTSSSSSINIVNGNSSAKLLWAVGLEPKHEGTITIPSLAVAGETTNSLTLQVLAAPAGASNKQGDDVYIEVNAEPLNPYVQQQIRYSVKFYYAISLADGGLEEPRADGLVVRKLGQDQNYQAMVGGRRYHVLERHYALSAEKSGELTVPAISFRGRSIDAGDINSFFSRGRTVSARSDAVVLKVRSRPADSGVEMWLPAQQLSVSLQGLDATTAKVGDPLTLSLTLKAQGLSHEQLPELELPVIEGVDVYPDKSTTQTRDNDGWLFGQRERKFALVPKHSGKITVPSIRYSWWDTEHDRAAVAETPAQTIDVSPGATVATPQSISEPKVAAESEVRSTNLNAVVDSAAPVSLSAEGGFWRTLALISLGVWLVSVILASLMWTRRSHRKPHKNQELAKPTAAAEKMKFRIATSKSDPRAIAHALLAWAQSERPEVRNLGELSQLLSDPEQRSAIAAIVAARFGQVGSDNLSARLRQAFATGFSFSLPDSDQDTSVLPPLYPELRMGTASKRS